MAYLTEPEVAERLRCSTRRVKYLRLSGKLPFIKGRPVLIDDADLLSFIASMKEGAVLRSVGARGYQVDVPALDSASASEASAAIAQRVWRLRRLRTQYRKS